MEFLFVPLIIGLAMVFLAIGKILGKDKELHSCKSGAEDD